MMEVASALLEERGGVLVVVVVCWWWWWWGAGPYAAALRGYAGCFGSALLKHPDVLSVEPRC